MPLGDFFEQQYRFADVFNVLKLTDVELAILTGVMILNPGTHFLWSVTYCRWVSLAITLVCRGT